jgi:hypothetical protein
MRVPAFPLVASLVLLAAPAFAQSSGAGGNPADQNGAASPSTAWHDQSGVSSTNPEQGSVPTPSTAWHNQSAVTGANSEESGASASSDTWRNASNLTTDTQQKLKQSLEHNGFKNVVVAPSSFVIHAQAPDGSHIVMLVSPDQMNALITPSTGSSTEPGGSSSSESGTSH